ncbi:hypothetical protein C0989_004797 [Termitomyces sp. Mn162]|nr:hypothetical protein C0989_004797 [Termitomyces sp. Mn162]
MDQDLIKLVNRLQDTIVGRDFLPRGQGIVTRRPLVLQLIHTPIPAEPSPNAPPYTEWAQFLHIDKRFTDFNEIRKEIEQETFRVAGQNKGVSKLPISLRIYSPDVLDLTLVDLPGLTKIPVGDQPSDIERQIRNLILDYISKPNSVILSVSPANVDLANSESLKLARQVDPQGRRTIGVLTKLDLMDAGTNALDILTGRIYPLKLGFIGVVNRSQQDINSEKSMSDALESENEFFRGHPAYRNISHKNGTKYLAKTLNQQGSLILRLMTQFARDFVASIEGTRIDISTKELSGGARIYYIFNDVFGQALASIDATHNLESQDIRTAIRNSTGPRPSLFVPEIAFDLLVKPQIGLLEAPSLRCVELVYEELVKICHNCTNAELERFPRLHAQLIEVVSELLRERLGPTSEYAQSLIEIQAAYINTNHPAFISGSALTAQQNNIPQRPPAPPRPTSTEPTTTNGLSLEEEDETSSEDSIFPPRDSRSVSSTVHDRSRSSISASTTTPSIAVGTVDKHTSRSRHSSQNQTQTQNARDSHRPQSGPVPNGSGSSPTARETFLNYFFGQNGPGPISGSSVERSQHAVGAHAGGQNTISIVPVGRDVSGAETVLSQGLMAGKRGIDGNSAAYDMKSLGKHIEAVSVEGTHMTPREEMETSLIRSLIASYFNIVRQSIQDLIPKAIMHLLVNHTSQHVQNRLVSSLYKPELFADMLNEDEALVAERARVKALLDAYKEAFKILSDVNLKST